MTIFARVRNGFTVVLGDITHEAGALLRLTEGVFGLHAHKLEVVPADEADGQPVANDTNQAVDPAPADKTAPLVPADDTMVKEEGAKAASTADTPAPDAADQAGA